MVPYGIDLNQLPREDRNSKAIVIVHDAHPLATIPPSQRGYGQSYYAQPVLIAPQQPLLLKGPREGPVVDMRTETRMLPPIPNKRSIGVKTNAGESSQASNTPLKKNVLTSRGFVPRRLEPSHQRMLQRVHSTPSSHHPSVARLSPTWTRTSIAETT